MEQNKKYPAGRPSESNIVAVGKAKRLKATTKRPQLRLDDKGKPVESPAFRCFKKLDDLMWEWLLSEYPDVEDLNHFDPAIHVNA